MTANQEEIKRRKEAAEAETGKELNIDSFGEIVDGFLKEIDAKILVTLPAGTEDAEISTNIGMGPVIDFYVFLRALKPLYRMMLETMGKIDHALDAEKLAEALCQIMKDDLLEVNDDDNG